MGIGGSDFPPRRGQRGFERKIRNWLAREGVLYRARVGCPWRDLPGEYGDHHTVYMRWQRWAKSGVPQRALIVSLSETQVLAVFLSGGQQGDAPAGEERPAEGLGYEEVEAVGGDRAYDHDAIRAMIAAVGKAAVIPPRANHHKQRNKAERLFNNLKGYWAVATRYDKLASMFLGNVLASFTGGQPQMYREHALADELFLQCFLGALSANKDLEQS